MFQQVTRRLAIQLMSAGTALFGWRLSSQAKAQTASDSDPLPMVGRWSKTHDRVWLGEEFWANPMENWRIVDGAAECQTVAGNRNIQLLTHQLTKSDAGFAMTVEVEQVEIQEKDGGAGFRVGIRSDLNEYRSNCFSKGGINAGVTAGQLTLGRKSQPLAGNADARDLSLLLTGEPEGDQYQLTLTAKTTADGKVLGTVSQTFPQAAILGNVALVSGLSVGEKSKQGSRYRFRNWRVSGDAFTVTPGNAFGPILWSMYSLSDSRSKEGFVLKLSALTGPLGADDNQQLELQVNRQGAWVSLGTASLDPDAWVATFRVPNWDASVETPYRVVYREKHRDGTESASEWTGNIKANPEGRPLQLGALTCQNDYGFPYEPVANNLLKLDPDMLYFSGDQIYEGHGGYGIIRRPAEPAILNYLRKFYQFGWAFREAMRDRPTLCLPDDHDVFQGNIWGEGGAAMNVEVGGASSNGGYIEPARMVNAVHRTCVSHHPDPDDPTPCLQDISVYHGDMVYGGVSFAIIADRQWKSGPEHVETGSGRADHVADPDFDCSTLDKPGLVLLGERQEEFLKRWSEDWRGHTIKVLLSQTVFAGVATHHGKYDDYLKADLDCGSWPQTARNQAIDIIRKSMALHINGDQHLTSLCQYGVDRQRDSNWSFCTPAISAGYPRWWRPDELGMPHENRPAHKLPDTGEYLDGFGNKVYVYAVGNPEVGTEKNRYKLAHQKGSGFGLVTIDPQQKTYHLQAFRFLVDAVEGDASLQFPGWPVTIHQAENRGENQLS